MVTDFTEKRFLTNQKIKDFVKFLTGHLIKDSLTKNYMKCVNQISNYLKKYAQGVHAAKTNPKKKI
jgi:hypothetical protein